MDRRMMNEWLKAQAQKQQLTERSFQQKRLGMAITEQLTPKEEKFAKANRHILSEMVKRYGSDKGTQLFYSSVREQVKKINEDNNELYSQREGKIRRGFPIQTDEYGVMDGDYHNAGNASTTKISPMDVPTGKPNLGINPRKMSISPEIADRYEAARQKKQDQLYIQNSLKPDNKQNDVNNYLTNRYAEQLKNSLSGKNLLPKTIMANPEIAGEQMARHEYENEMIGQRPTLNVDKSRQYRASY